MISLIKGIITKFGNSEKNSYLDILTNSGVGYRVLVPSNQLFATGEEVIVYTSFQVREDSQTLFGFGNDVMRDFFELLITVSGVGPKTAMNILSTYTMAEVVGYINERNHKALSKVSGLGSKSAQKIIVELENRVEGYEGISGSENSMLKDLKDALSALGFSGKVLDGYVKKGEEYVDDVQSVDLLIKIVLQEN